MQSRKTITIVTSPPSATSSLPACDNCVSPTTKKGGPVQYRIEERTRTIYVTSDVHPNKWDQRSITELLKVTELSDEEQTDSSNSRLSVRRSRSQPLDASVNYMSDPRSSISSPESRDFSSRTMSQHRRPDARIRTNLQIPTMHAPIESPSRYTPQTPFGRPRVLFYHKHNPHYGFTNFSPHPVAYKGKKYPTSEHLFQSFKFHDHRPGLAEHIRTCSERPSVAFSEARRFQPEVRPDWLKINIQKMEEALWHKFTQHPDLKAELLSTGNGELIEDSDKDAFWGWGADRKGRNELGKALERLRARLREA
ncbi:hypothetical protein AX17_006614 [Amanita inopinata Kibby_2008]|nr:hypothetical protein AX17_006614 [Amanita inopinata Kibby_2008]